MILRSREQIQLLPLLLAKSQDRGNPYSLGRPRERRPLFGGVYVLVPIWLGAPRPAWRPLLDLPWSVSEFLGRYLVTVVDLDYGFDPKVPHFRV